MRSLDGTYDEQEEEAISHLLDFAVRLARGPRDEVWSGWSFGARREVVVKLFTNPSKSERLVQEARALARIHHPNVARILDAGRLGLDAYVATELLRGETLADRLRREGPLTTSAALELLLPLLDGLESLHAAGLLHRDVRPGTIFLARDGAAVRPLLFGFGLGQTDETAAARAAFLAPEVLAGEAPTARSDLYSLARVAVACLEPRAEPGGRRRSAAAGDPVLDMVGLFQPWLVGPAPGRPSARELRRQAQRRLAALEEPTARRARRR